MREEEEENILKRKKGRLPFISCLLLLRAELSDLRISFNTHDNPMRWRVFSLSIYGKVPKAEPG